MSTIKEISMIISNAMDDIRKIILKRRLTVEEKIDFYTVLKDDFANLMDTKIEKLKTLGTDK